MADVAVPFGEECLEKFDMGHWEASGYNKRGEIVVKTKDDTGKIHQFRSQNEAMKLFKNAADLFPDYWDEQELVAMWTELKKINAERRGVEVSPAPKAQPAGVDSVSADTTKKGGASSSGGAEGSGGKKRKAQTASEEAAPAAGPVGGKKQQKQATGTRAAAVASHLGGPNDEAAALCAFLADAEHGPGLSIGDARRAAGAVATFVAPRALALLARNLKLNAVAADQE